MGFKHVLLFAVLFQMVAAFEITGSPPQKPQPKPGESPQPFTNPLKTTPRAGKRPVHMRKFAKIPNFKGIGSKIVGMTGWKSDLYVTTSTSGGYVYKVTSAGRVSLWLDVGKRLKAETGRILDCRSGIHGGLRSIAFPPDFAKTGLFYLSLMEERPKDIRKFTYFGSPGDGTGPDSVIVEWKYNFKKRKVVWGSYRNVMRIAVPVLDHPIKQISFQGRLLLITHGDASTQKAVGGGGLKNDGLGKVMRINPKKFGKFPYRIPSSNPFLKTTKWKNELYAVGFRNPHNLCYSRKHGMYVTDVGRDNVEEVNIVVPGGSYGWPKREGTFTHLVAGGTGYNVGVTKLPKNDAKFNFIYPAVQIGHFAPRGRKIYGQALAGSCPIENGSPLEGIFMYANFAEGGELYYSLLRDMKKAVTKGPPEKLTQAPVYNATIYFDHDNDRKTRPLKLRTLLDVIGKDDTKNPKRIDMRFGVGTKGEVYWSSKKNGGIYLITSTLPGASV